MLYQYTEPYSTIFIKIIIMISQASFDQLVVPRTIDTIVERSVVSINRISIIIICIITIIITINRFLASDFCSTIPDERCPVFLEAVLRQGLPALVDASNPDEYPEVFIENKTVLKLFFKKLH